MDAGDRKHFNSSLALAETSISSKWTCGHRGKEVAQIEALPYMIYMLPGVKWISAWKQLYSAGSPARCSVMK